jgi:hypothetical protein
MLPSRRAELPSGALGAEQERVIRRVLVLDIDSEQARQQSIGPSPSLPHSSHRSIDA